MFQAVDSGASFPDLELQTLDFWRRARIYERSLQQRAGAEAFVFFEGPPTANGMPHPGHCLTRAVKDLFPRYLTMRGKLCTRKAGWDTHGLPVEVEVCKELGIHSREEIEAYGIEPFIQLCQRSVWRYMQEWERLTERLGFWVNLEEAYITYHQSYIESVWWSLKNLFDRGLLYLGHKIVWWWAQGGTALSSGEVGQGYKSVADPSVFVLFPLVEDDRTRKLGLAAGTSLLVWTTTPWTLPSNQFSAVNASLDYAVVHDPELNQRIILAKDLVEPIAAKVKRELKVEAIHRGEALIGLRYLPPFDFYFRDLGQQLGRLKAGGEEAIAWRVTSADFVTTESGSGVVHEAPAFGEVDFELLQREQARFADGQGPGLLCAVGPNGKFTDEAPEFAGMWVKDADKPIIRRLKEAGRLYHQEQYLHEYPFCWRADSDPLIQYPRRSWFIRTTEFKDRMLANNRQINWLPGHIRDGRFGNFLESNVDWALSRERYWGTPLPIWVCQVSGKMEAVGSYAELLAKPGVGGLDVWEQAKAAAVARGETLVDDLRIHKPYIDAIEYDSPFQAGGRMRRVTEVIDCWYDSGAMPFAQWGYPHQNREQFESQFPADFISEAIDQTRGWFYSLLAISTLLFGEKTENLKSQISNLKSQIHLPHPFRNCIVLGLMLGEDGQKMSKSRRNYREPNEIFERYGADALRWYFFANQPPWTSIRYREQAIKDSIPEFLLRLWNVYGFFVNYANTDGFNPADELPGPAGQLATSDLARAKSWRAAGERSELDRWLLGELNQTVTEVTARMDAYDSYGACQRLNAFVDALSNWYVRRSRDRFWSNDRADRAKLDAYWTLYEALLTTCKLVAPFVPFIAETMWRNLAGEFGDRVPESVHLCDYPQADASAIDAVLSDRMNLLREIASLGRGARMEAKLKVRQPLSGLTVALNDDRHRQWLADNDSILRDELNVRAVSFTSNAAEFVTYQVQPNFKLLGPKVGRLMPAVKKRLGEIDGGSVLSELAANGVYRMVVDGEVVELDGESIAVRLLARPGWAAAQGNNCVVALATGLTPELVREGIARDVVRTIQERRKELGLQFADRIQVGIGEAPAELQAAVREHSDWIMSETLALELGFEASGIGEAVTREAGDMQFALGVQRLAT